ncbi:protein MEI2-like 4 isoform X2 [Amborella trichopoda]|uniref:protein MEI2-like 4 isoform X2 n=1 Tax=Amborella trichopoda TaxID=13333 RepID=UPI0005D3FC65|nr:protein MEI2-like 4 isoform X2 [Amborella trichopoda]|eukprot:XP_011623405.1 protein MEI2-like 4 isoform X2 [Amborella trichopoda]
MMPFEVDACNVFIRCSDLKKMTDQRKLPSLYSPSVASSFFSEDKSFPAERQVGFWKHESMSDQHGVRSEEMSVMSGSKAVGSSPLQKFGIIGAHSVDFSELARPYAFKGQKPKLAVEGRLVGAERTATLSTNSWKSMEQELGLWSDFLVRPAASFVGGNSEKLDAQKAHFENGLFSSSFSEIFEKKLSLTSRDALVGQSIDAVGPHLEDDMPFESLEEMEAQAIGDLLPDDDDLLSGVLDEIDFSAPPCNGEDMEEFDLFSSGGGMELEGDDCYGGGKNSDIVGGIPNGQQGGSNSSSFAGEHPYGEHPSRTLFVRNINSSVEDAELRDLFEQYGDIRTLYTACKHRGFVMISYYDIRAARNAMRALQNKPLRRRKLDIHFSIPKFNIVYCQDNPSEKDINQGTLVVFNLDSSVSNDDLRQIFGVYGEIKEIRETPHKRHHKFIEFYDVRAAEAALRALNRSDIAGKRIKLEPSRPGGARRLMQQLCQELEHDEAGLCRPSGSPPDNSPSGCYGSFPHGTITPGSLDNGAIQGLHSTIQAPLSPYMDAPYHGISSSVPHALSSPVSVASAANHDNSLSEQSHSVGHNMNFGFQGMPAFHPHSLPEYHNGLSNGVPYNSPGAISGLAGNINSRPAEGVDGRAIHARGSNGFNNHSYEMNENVLGVSGNGSCPLHGPQFVWGNPNAYHHPHAPGPMMWSSSPSFVNGVHSRPPQLHGFPRADGHLVNPVLSLHHHHVGSAPVMNPSLWDRRHGYTNESADASGFHPGSLGSVGFAGSSGLHPIDLAAHNLLGHHGANNMNPSLSSPNLGLPSPQHRHMYPPRSPMMGMPAPFDNPTERARSRRNEASSNQADNKKQYELDIDRILRGEDIRTTLMIKNIPNKYTSKMLLAAIDERHRGTYDFIYLPIDFKNKCNVGYAFINMTDPMQIVPFFEAFDGKKWEKFNSEKVASLAYARIQGKAALIAHFQNSSLMNEDKRCRPILFHSDGPNAGDQEPFPMGVNVRTRPGKSRSSSNEEISQGSPPTSGTGDDSSNGNDSSKDGE